MCVDFFMNLPVKADCQQDQSESLNYFLIVNFYELGRPPVDNLQAVTFQRYPLHPSAECTAFSEFIASGFLYLRFMIPGRRSLGSRCPGLCSFAPIPKGSLCDRALAYYLLQIRGKPICKKGNSKIKPISPNSGLSEKTHLINALQ